MDKLAFIQNGITRIKELINNGYSLDYIHCGCRTPYNPSQQGYRYSNSIQAYLYNASENSFDRVELDLDNPPAFDTSDIIKFLKEYFETEFKLDLFIVCEDRYITYIELINKNIIKMSYAGKYKDTVRITKTYKGINSSNNYWYGTQIYRSFTVTKYSKSLDQYNIDKYNDKDSDIVKKIKNMYAECIKNFENITIPEIRSFIVSVNNRKIEYTDFRDINGSGVNLSMIPDPSKISSTINDCINRVGKDYVYINSNCYFNIHNIEQEFNIEAKQYSNGERRLVLKHKKNNIDANKYWMSIEDLQNIMSILKEQEEKDYIESLILLVELA